MRAPALIALSLLCGPAYAQDKLTGTNVDARIAVTFKASDTAVQRMLPEGWEINSPASGPGKGSNLGLTLIEQVVSLDAQGSALEPARGIVLVVPAKKKGTDVTGPMVVAGLFSPSGAPGAYGVYLPAKVTMERKQRIDGDGKVLVEERWSAQGADDHAIDVEVQYVRGKTAKGKGEAKVYSGSRPDFYRIYKTETVNDVVRSADVNQVSMISVKASGAKLRALLDGTEKVVSVTSIPSYSRQVFLPAK